MSKSVEKAVAFMESIAADNSHGYDQTNRLGGVDYDCSSLVAAGLRKGGFNVSASSTTRNLYAQLINDGWKPCSKPWKRGDIHLSVGHHVVMSTDANNIVHASINEKGTATGGKAGDQTGKEICVRSYYEHSSGWTYHLRYTESSTVSAQVTTASSNGKTFTKGKTYTVDVDGLTVRTGAGTSCSAKTYAQLSANARKYAYKNGTLKKGTVVTCQETRTLSNGSVWVKIPSGWVCGYTSSGKTYLV